MPAPGETRSARLRAELASSSTCGMTGSRCSAPAHAVGVLHVGCVGCAVCVCVGGVLCHGEDTSAALPQG